MSPPDVRGTLVSLKEAMVVLGMLLGYLIGKLRTDLLIRRRNSRSRSCSREDGRFLGVYVFGGGS